MSFRFLIPRIANRSRGFADGRRADQTASALHAQMRVCMHAYAAQSVRLVRAYSRIDYDSMMNITISFRDVVESTSSTCT